MAAPKRSRNASPNVVAQAKAKGSGGPSTARWLWENVKSLAGALLIFLLIKTFAVEAFRIPSGSMIPTLQVGDWLFVNKIVYGPTVPFGHKPLFHGYQEPKRGEVIVFESPYQADQPEDPTPTLVKRMVGAPGDTLYMREGLLYVNGLPQRQGYAAASNHKGDPNESSPLFDWQHKFEIRGSRFGAPPVTPLHDAWGPLVIPAGHYMMMGDNRYCSKDSRYWGLVPRDNIRGRPIFVYYSYVPGTVDDPNCSGDPSNRPLSFLSDIRWSRIGTVIR